MHRDNFLIDRRQLLLSGDVSCAGTGAKTSAGKDGRLMPSCALLHELLSSLEPRTVIEHPDLETSDGLALFVVSCE